jgi:hypothetical protein
MHFLTKAGQRALDKQTLPRSVAAVYCARIAVESMSSIKLFELGPTRSARVRWMLLEAELPYDSAGNSVEVFRSAELRSIHPLGKLPAALIDGKLFESAGHRDSDRRPRPRERTDCRTGDLV